MYNYLFRYKCTSVCSRRIHGGAQYRAFDGLARARAAIRVRANRAGVALKLPLAANTAGGGISSIVVIIIPRYVLLLSGAAAGGV